MTTASVAPTAQVTHRGSVATAAVVAQDVRELLVGVAIGGLIVAGMGVGSGTLTLAGVAAAIGASVLAPRLGLVVLAFMSVLRPPDVVPAPGFNTLMAGALLAGA